MGRLLLASVLRDQAFAEMERIAALAESYSRSMGEAAWRGDRATVEAHLRQLRLCCINLIQIYKDCLDEKPDPRRDREDF